MPRYNLSCVEHTDEGKFLGYLYYSTSVLDVFTRDERFGFPHNGGVHTLCLRISPADLDAFFDLLIEIFGRSVHWNGPMNAFIQNAQQLMTRELVAV